MSALSRERLTVFAIDPHAASEDEIREMAAELIMERSQFKVLATMARQHGDLLQRVVELAGADTEDVRVWAAAVDQVVTEHLALRVRVREFQAWQRGVVAQFGRLGFDRYHRLVEGQPAPTDLSDALDAVLDERDRLRAQVAALETQIEETGANGFRLTSTFCQSASIEAIDHYLPQQRRAHDRLGRVVTRLEALADERRAQIETGTWPNPEASQ